MDVVSGGEYCPRPKAAGVSGDKIVFSGSRKNPQPRCDMALTGGIRQFNVESEPEMVVPCPQWRTELGVEAPITDRRESRRRRKDPRQKIATGRKGENKFGIPISRARELSTRWPQNLRGLKVIGIDVHIGSSTDRSGPVRGSLSEKVADLDRTAARGWARDWLAWTWAVALGIPYAPGDNEAPAAAQRSTAR